MRKLTETQLRELLVRLKTGLVAIYGARLKGVFLFGSYARGDARDESDVDVLIVLDRVESPHRELEYTSELNARISLDYCVSVSRVFASEDRWREGRSSFLHNLREEAVAA